MGATLSKAGDCLKRSGSNANQNIDIGSYNFKTLGDISAGLFLGVFAGDFASDLYYNAAKTYAIAWAAGRWVFDAPIRLQGAAGNMDLDGDSIAHSSGNIIFSAINLKFKGLAAYTLFTRDDDVGQIGFCGGSAVSSANGAYFQVFGNAHATDALKGEMRIGGGRGDASANIGHVCIYTVGPGAGFTNELRLNINGGVAQATADFQDTNLKTTGTTQSGGYKSSDGSAGITQSEAGVTDFDIVIKDGLVVSFTKN
jgi:hypothetical protein